MKSSNSEIKKNRPRIIRSVSFILLVIVLIIGGIKGWRIYQKSMIVYRGVYALRGMFQTPITEIDIDTVELSLLDLQSDLNDLNSEVEPFLWLAPGLGWVPVYGGDLTQAPMLIELAGHVVDASVISLNAGQPLLNKFNSLQGSSLDPSELTALLVDMQPQLRSARNDLDKAIISRDQIQMDRLSPRLYTIINDELDPLMKMMDDGLTLSEALPTMLGAAETGPKNYLLLVQNEDELRATGGFITSIGNMVVLNGRLLGMEFEGVDNRADWSRPYPSAPWQLQEYMNTSALILRDSNWSADYPTNALWARYLYGYNHSDPVDGVIAFDQQFLVILLRATGPLTVDGAPYPITSQNVIEYMRSAKSPPLGEPIPAEWDRKQFISTIADALFEKIINGQGNNWRDLIIGLQAALEERHLLLQFDDPAIMSLLAKYDWDNAVRPDNGDFLMMTDTNIGFNKTSALVDVSLSYDVDLTDVYSPASSLVVTHYNNASQDVPCIHWGYKQVEGVEWYPMDRCYWNYLRVYKQAGVELLDASPHRIPGEWMILGKTVPARVDVLDEDLNTVQGFGTLLVVPGSQSVHTGFDFKLPETVISHIEGSDQYIYRFKFQKQPGTLANPLVIRIHLPDRSQVETINLDAVIQGNNLLIETNLRTDVHVELVFRVP